MPTWQTAPAWTAHQTANVSTGLQKMSDDLNVIGGAWASTWVPTLTNLTLGNGTAVALFVQAGKTVDFFYELTLGSTSAISNPASITLPVTANRANWYGWGGAFDTSASAYYPLLPVASTTTTLLIRTSPATAGNSWPSISSTAPMTWATGDVLTVQGRYDVP